MATFSSIVASTRVAVNSSRARRAKTLSTPRPRRAIWPVAALSAPSGRAAASLCTDSIATLSRSWIGLKAAGSFTIDPSLIRLTSEMGPRRDFQFLAAIVEVAEVVDDLAVNAMGVIEQTLDACAQLSPLGDGLFQRGKIGLQPLHECRQSRTVTVGALDAGQNSRQVGALFFDRGQHSPL